MIDANSQFFAILTNVGMAKQANADALGIPWKITEMGVGDANNTDPIPSAAQTRLINEWRRRPLNQLKIDPINPAVIIAEQVIPADEGGHWIREIGLYDEGGDLVAVANCAPSFKPVLSQGSGRTQVVRMNLIVSSTGSITLKIDPGVVLATRAYVDQKIIDIPAASTAQFGLVRLANQAAVDAGFDEASVVTPLTLGVRLAAAINSIGAATAAAFGLIRLATQAQVDAGVDTARAVTPVTLAARLSAVIGAIPAASAAFFGLIRLATQADVDAGSDEYRAVTPLTLAARLTAAISAIPAATGVARGLIRLATQAQVDTGTDTATAVTPATLATRLAAAIGAIPAATAAALGLIRLATQAQVDTGTDAATAVTPVTLTNRLGAWFKTVSNVVASRALNVTYTNTTGRTMFVNLALVTTGNNQTCSLIVNGASMFGGSFPSTGFSIAGSFLVPAGATYMVPAGSYTLQTWYEVY